MKVPKELQEQIENLFKNNEDIKEKLLNGDTATIQQIGLFSRNAIKPSEIIDAYENNSVDTLYKKAKHLVKMQELYCEMCNWICMVDISDLDER